MGKRFVLADAVCIGRIIFAEFGDSNHGPNLSSFPRKNRHGDVKAFAQRKQLESEKSTQILCEQAGIAVVVNRAKSG